MNEFETVRSAVELVERKGDRLGAIAILTPLAEAGHADAQFHLGRMYVGLHINAMYCGPEPPHTATEADRWLRAAMEQGHPFAAYERAEFHQQVQQHKLGAKYDEPDNPDKDAVQNEFRDAVRRLEKAVVPGDAHTPYLLGQAYLFGNGFPPSPEEAMYWFHVAYLEGAYVAADVLCGHFGEKCRAGLERGDVSDCLKAIYWLRKAREKRSQCTGNPVWESLMVAHGLLKPEETSNVWSRREK